jgi:hypothetical protein
MKNVQKAVVRADVQCVAAGYLGDYKLIPI